MVAIREVASARREKYAYMRLSPGRHAGPRAAGRDGRGQSGSAVARPSRADDRGRFASSRSPNARRRPDPTPSAILWDLDDTLFDHTGTSRRALAVVRSEFPALSRWSLTELHREYLELVERFHPRVLSGRLSSDEARVRRFAALSSPATVWAGRGDPRRMAIRYREAYAALRRPVPGALALVRSLARDCAIAVVSNNPTAEQEEKLRALGLDRWVDALVTSHDVGVPKPSPRIFREALVRAGARPDAAVMVGDSWAYDVLGARAAGLRAVWFNRWRRPIPDPRVADQLDALSPVRESGPVILGLGRTSRGRSLPTSPSRYPNTS
jgi:HAD superfamily hydrolase (TIGR01509 family)